MNNKYKYKISDKFKYNKICRLTSEMLSGTEAFSDARAFSDAKAFSYTEKPVMLTFDDGPDPTYTRKLLNLLSSLDVKATFFTVGRFAEENPDLIRRMAEEGHTVGIHSYSHKSAYLMTPSQIRKDMDKSVAALNRLGISPHFYRPPWGHTKKSVLSAAAAHHLVPVYWSVMADDWKADTNPEEIASKLISQTVSGSIICLHDGRGKNDAPKRTIKALKLTLPMWLYQGYRFVTADEAFRGVNTVGSEGVAKP